MIGTIIIAILVFGFLIFIHEFGHYIAARIFKVTINEFSIGMGPRLITYESKKTKIKYSIAAFPIGGFVAMAGEDEESDDPNSFDKKPAWQRLIITSAGALVNIFTGFIAVAILTAMINIGHTTVAKFADTEKNGYEISSYESGLIAGDEITHVDGKRVRIADELSYEIMRRGNEPVELTVIREGKEITLKDVVFPTLNSDGQTFGMMDFSVYRAEKSFSNFIKHVFFKSVLTVRMCWESIYDMLSGRYSFAAVSGPVGISGAIGDAARSGADSLISIVALISINLGVMNLLPLPALDGGRFVMILAEMISRKRVPKKVEAIINGVGLVLLLVLSFVIMIKDVVQLIV